jgi:hypothetical protein
MDQVTYAVVFSGGIVDGFAIISVKAHLARMLKIDATRMASLFSGKAVVLKRTADKSEALRYGGALKKVGADVSIKIIKTPVETAAPASAPDTRVTSAGAGKDTQPQAVTAPAAAKASFSLAPNAGNLFEPTPPPPPVQVDISSLSVVANSDAPLAPPKAVAAVQVDISSLSISANDGTPLVAPAVPVAKVAAPDFTLDAPGAVLDTIKEHKPEVKPDISSLSLAFPGGDLLEPEERQKTPAPSPPDVSKIHLATRFE